MCVLKVSQVPNHIQEKLLTFAPMTFNANHEMYKNQLQEFCQKSGLSLPVYTTENQGFPHKPMFRAKVFVCGVEVTSEKTFLRKKSAENDVAKLAFECISKKRKFVEPPSEHLQDIKLSKMILNEFAYKRNMKKPIYCTTSAEGTEPIYVSKLGFNGKTYTSTIAGSKKMAEQLAACKAIQSLLGSESGEFLAQIIKSKAIPQAQNIQTTPVKAENSSAHITSNTQYGGRVGDSTDRKRKLEAIARATERMQKTRY